MKKVEAEPYRDIDFSVGKRGPVIEPELGKTKVSLRLDNRVIDHFRELAEWGNGNYLALINKALVGQILQGSMLEAVQRTIADELMFGRRKVPAPKTLELCRGKGGYGVVADSVYVDLTTGKNGILLDTTQWIGLEAEQREVVFVWKQQVISGLDLPKGFSVEDAVVVSFERRKVSFFNFLDECGGYYLRRADVLGKA
ncbi:MAG: hypothetical protein ABJC13_16770 [Acidobacteriota bacterium]